ncbi:MAG: hypothetical protein K9K66_09185 [Desulfarculaceae bacterium]|nr:hypothetical protein [Desulfarculaceae bacterium]MCF8073095.1 hypothetical protein [Desulfarculaceae bacterium]MCF8101820.1 hypothetical protein [Desulfarculaceae bacterium]MCF8115347.1 hypothetical protein [Desulfarculaceae bacterium]
MQDAPELRPRAEQLSGRKLSRVRLVHDTSMFMELEPGDVLELEGVRFVVTGTEYEGRFGLSDQPKPWVKRAVAWEDGSAKIIKLVFHEEFHRMVGGFKVRCYRSPEKEARILALVRGDGRFMQGITLRDTAGNAVRVLERIRGGRMDLVLEDVARQGHQVYFQRHLRGVLSKLTGVFQAIGWLHAHGERHGDVRRDHVLADSGSGQWAWIDFDYNYDLMANPFALDLYGLGNILWFAVAGHEVTYHWLKQDHPEILERLRPEDYSPALKNRLMNLKKVYPYLPDSLNNVLLHFSAGSPVFYERVEELMAELAPAIGELPQGEDAP